MNKDIHSASRRKTSVSVNQELLGQVSRLLRTSTVKETIEQALLEVLRNHARAEEVASLSSMAGLDLARPNVMKRAWRH
jgi:Arc/MetJ family transcription regulator